MSPAPGCGPEPDGHALGIHRDPVLILLLGGSTVALPPSGSPGLRVDGTQTCVG